MRIRSTFLLNLIVDVNRVFVAWDARRKENSSSFSNELNKKDASNCFTTHHYRFWKTQGPLMGYER